MRERHLTQNVSQFLLNCADASILSGRINVCCVTKMERAIVFKRVGWQVGMVYFGSRTQPSGWGKSQLVFYLTGRRLADSAGVSSPFAIGRLPANNPRMTLVM